MKKSDLPTVTQILKPWIDFSNVPKDRLEMAAKRGTRIHAAASSIALGVPILRREPEDEGYIQSFRNWFGRYVIKVVGVELELSDPVYKFIGHLDFIFELMPGMIPELGSGEFVAVDLKTPITQQKSWRAQAAAYLHLARVNDYPARAAASLQLDPDGGLAKMNWYLNDKRDFVAFLNCLSAWNYFKGGTDGI